MMQVSKWGNSLAIRIPAVVVEVLGLKEGDEINVKVADRQTLEVERNPDREKALEIMRSFRRPLPAGWRFNRDDIYDR